MGDSLPESPVRNRLTALASIGQAKITPGVWETKSLAYPTRFHHKELVALTKRLHGPKTITVAVRHEIGQHV